MVKYTNRHWLRSYKDKIKKIILNSKCPYTGCVYVFDEDLNTEDGFLFKNDGINLPFQYLKNIENRWGLGLTNNNGKVDYSLKCD
ncbi:MAG: hypothetical protein HOG03_15685 [Desulfobacula sp.]|uniref:hypothetical protein n=1 Tax=Desulfobacula sp. TaxID=2593537 RepID=UPI001D80BAA3|nr:hypothetical protein [Desulfobacula sp.]MBT4509224.1 hypothetical protein [Desulfobacula sp.]MBT6338186.1 hypothetical protein [Desulfobacula sp.]